MLGHGRPTFSLRDAGVACFKRTVDWHPLMNEVHCRLRSSLETLVSIHNGPHHALVTPPAATPAWACLAQLLSQIMHLLATQP